jgi:hypothetical protein
MDLRQERMTGSEYFASLVLRAVSHSEVWGLAPAAWVMSFIRVDGDISFFFAGAVFLGVYGACCALRPPMVRTQKRAQEADARDGFERVPPESVEKLHAFLISHKWLVWGLAVAALIGWIVFLSMRKGR